MTRGRIYLRGRIFWLAYYYKGKDRCESSRSTDKRDAEILLAKRLGEIGADIAGVKRWLGQEAEKVLITSLLDELLQDYEVSGKKSLIAARGRMPPLCRSFYQERVRDVDTGRLRRYIQERRREGMAPATIKLELAFLHRAYVLAHREGRIAQVPAFPSIEVDNARQGFLEKADFEAVCSHLSPVLAGVATFAYLSGWRKMEVCNLTWAEVDLDGKVAKLSPERSKSKRGRTLPLVGELWKILQCRHLLRFHADLASGVLTVCPWVFHREGEPIKQFRTAWKTACRKAGVQGTVFHDLRRTTVRNLLRAGVSQRTAMEITGHKTASVFHRYDIVDEEDKRVAQEKMQAYLGTGNQERKIIPMEGRG